MEKRIVFSFRIFGFSRAKQLYHFRFSGALLLLIACFSFLSAFAQPSVLGTQLVNGAYTTYNLNATGGFRQVRLQAASGAAAGLRNWEFAEGTAAVPNYSINWRPYSGSCNGNPNTQLAAYNQLVAPNTSFPAVTATATRNTGSGGCSGYLPSVTSGNYYTFNVAANAAANNEMAVLETSFNPTNFLSTSQYPLAPTSTSGVTVVVTMAAAPNAGERVYVRYSTNAFASSVIVPVVFAGGSTGRAAIPALAGTVQYYFFSAPTTAGTPTPADADMLTLNLLNNAGANYAYSVAGTFLQYERNSFSAGYTPITTGGGATAIVSGSATFNFSSTAALADADNGAALIPLPFDFSFGGTNYTAGTNYVNVAVNGFLSFATSNSNAVKQTSASSEFLFTSGNIDAAIAGWWDDLAIGSGQVLYQTAGTAPNRTFTVQYGSVLSYASAATSTINFQVVLFESSHSIELRYGTAGNALHNAAESAAIGLEWGSGGIGSFVDAVSGATTMGGSMNHSEQFPALHYRFFPVAAAPLALTSGTYNAGVGQVYPTLSEAIADLNHRGVAGAVSIVCTDAGYSNANGNIYPFNIGPIKGASAVNNVIIDGGNASLQMAGVYQGSLITTSTGIALSSASNLGIVNVAGADFLTFSNFSLGLAAAFPAGITKPCRGLQVINHSAIDGTTNNVFQNLVITLDRTTSPLSMGVYQHEGAEAITALSGTNSDNKYYTIVVRNAYAGIYLLGNALYPDAGNLVGGTPSSITQIGAASANDIGNGSNAVFGIKAEYQSGVKIFNCDVRNLNGTSSVEPVDGILLLSSAGVNEIYNNTVHDLRTSSAAAATNFVTGIRLLHGTSTVRVYNNFVYGLTSGYSGAGVAMRQLKGIWSAGTGGTIAQSVNIDFNSVRLDASSSLAISSACVEVATVAGPIIHLRNNIFANFTGAQTGAAKHYTAVSPSATLLGPAGSVWNRNIYFVSNTLNGFTGLGNATDLATLTNWRSAFGTPAQDLNSFATNPQFASASDLHVSTASATDVESGGSYFGGAISWVSTDIDNVTRSTSMPDIGADEISGCSDNNLQWTGLVSNDWHVAGNWCGNSIPTINSRVVIPAGTPFNPSIINNNANAFSVTINSGATFIFNGAFNLNIAAGGSFTNNGIFSNNSTGSTVFQGSATIDGTVSTNFRNLKVNGLLTVLRVPTFTGVIDFLPGAGMTAAPFYSVGSELRYLTTVLTVPGSEWLPGITAGAGVPQNVTIGAAGTHVNFGTSTDFRQVLGNLAIGAGSTLSLSTVAGGDLQVGNSWTNNGSFNANGRRVTFNFTVNSFINGSSLTSFGELAINKGSSILNIVDVNSNVNVTVSSNTTISNGLLRINAGGSITKSGTGTWNINSNTGLHINGGSFTQSAGSLNNDGLFRITSGTATIGTADGHVLQMRAGSSFDMQGGTVNIASRFENTGTATIGITGGTLNLCTVGNTSATGTFDIAGTSALSITGSPALVFQTASVNASPKDLFLPAGAGIKTISGGTFQFGNAVTPAGNIFKISSVFGLTNVTLNAINIPGVRLDQNLQINGTLNFAGANMLDINGRTLLLNGPINNGAGSFAGTTTSYLNIAGSGAITGNLNFAPGLRNLANLNVNRNGVPVGIGSNLTLHVDGSTISAGSIVTVTAASTLAMSAGGIAGITIYGTLNVQGVLQLNAGGFVNGGGAGMRGPLYAAASTLVYNNGGSFTRNVEWGSNTPATEGYPHHVIIQNGTTVDFSNTTTFNVGCAGNLSLGHPTAAGAGTLSLTSFANPYDLYVAGDLVIGGTIAAGSLLMSNNIGNDIYIGASWTRTATGSVHFGAGNGRAVFFEGSANGVISAVNGQTFPYVFINKADRANRITLADHVNISYEINFTRGTVDLATNNKFLTILSTSTNTGRVGPSDLANTDFIYGAGATGQFIVQRYVPARRSWRLMAAPFKSVPGQHSISEAWQERLTGLNYSTAAGTIASIAADTISAGFGTQITGGSIANGFDLSATNNTSIRYFNAGTWLTPANLNATGVNSQEGWMLFLRGDRKNYGQITNQYKTPTITTLRPRGQIFIGSKSVTAAGPTVVGNPYASAVDFNTITKTGAGWPANATYYVWDPYLGGATGQGAFVTLTWNGTDFSRSSPYGVGTVDNRYIPSGAAILVDFPAGGGTLTFNETDKAVSGTTTAFRPGPVSKSQLMTVLNTVNADGTTYVSDAVLTLFHQQFNNAADINDAAKLTNFTETFGIAKEGRLLSIERRRAFGTKDTVCYSMARMQRKNYQFQFIPGQLNLPGSLQAYLEDTVLHKQTPVSLTDTTFIPFSITSNEDAAAGRFRLIFRKATSCQITHAKQVSGGVSLQFSIMDQQDQKAYVIERSLNGKDFAPVGTITANGNANESQQYQWLDPSVKPGVYYYRIVFETSAGATAISNVMELKVVNGIGSMYVFPNPVKGNRIQLQLNNQSAGIYDARLLSASGAVLVQKQIQHGGGSAIQVVEAPAGIAAGYYTLEVKTVTGALQQLRVVLTK